MSPAASPSRRSDQGRVFFLTRTLLFLVDSEKSCLGVTVPRRRIVAEIHRTKHNRRQHTHTTGVDSSGSFLRRTRHTLNASKGVRNWTPNRGEVGRYVSPAASPSRRSDHGRVLFSARTLLFLVDPEKSCLGGTVPQRGIVLGATFIGSHVHTIALVCCHIAFTLSISIAFFLLPSLRYTVRNLAVFVV